MSTQLKLRRGTSAQHGTFTGASGEVTVDTTKKTLVVHDGVTAGGVPLARQDGSNATGTWPVAISGNAATATSATSATTAGNVTGTVAVANGGTGSTTAAAARTALGIGTVGVLNTNASTTQFLRGDGTWVAPTSGGVTSVATGNGLSGGPITSTGTLALAAPAANTVGSYAFIGGSNFPSGPTFGSNYAAGSGTNQVRTYLFYFNACGISAPLSAELSGTWKWMGSTNGSASGAYAVGVRVA